MSSNECIAVVYVMFLWTIIVIKYFKTVLPFILVYFSIWQAFFKINHAHWRLECFQCIIESLDWTSEGHVNHCIFFHIELPSCWESPVFSFTLAIAFMSKLKIGPYKLTNVISWPSIVKLILFLSFYPQVFLKNIR